MCRAGAGAVGAPRLAPRRRLIAQVRKGSAVGVQGVLAEESLHRQRADVRAQPRRGVLEPEPIRLHLSWAADAGHSGSPLALITLNQRRTAASTKGLESSSAAAAYSRACMSAAAAAAMKDISARS